MNETAVRAIAQSDPTANLTHRWGELVGRARHRTEELAQTLRHLDAIQDQLAERGIKVSVDLGTIGNAAMAARRDMDKTAATKPFKMPDAS